MKKYFYNIAPRFQRKSCAPCYSTNFNFMRGYINIRDRQDIFKV